MAIFYRDTLDQLQPQQLKGFFVGWTSPLTPEQHFKVLKNSYKFLLAYDEETQQIVGFINCLSDGIQSAFIPLLEVLPEYQGLGIGTQLMQKMLKSLEHINAIDLTCDEDMIPFYQRLDMLQSNSMVIRNYLNTSQSH